MCLTSCELSLEAIKNMIPGMQTTTVSTTTTTKRSKKTTTKKSSTTTEKKEEEPKWEASEHSITKKDLLERYTLTQEEVDNALALIDQMLEISMTAESVEQFEAEFESVYEAFDESFTYIVQQFTIARIIYYCNMKDEEAAERNLNTQDMAYAVQDKYQETCRTMYLESPYSEELFADWSEESIQELLDFDPKTSELIKEVEALQVEFDNLSNSEFTEGSVALYKQIIAKNNELARYYGYDNYYDYASERVYGRDYTAEDLQAYRQYIIEYVVPTFDNLNNGWRALYDFGDYAKNQTIDFISKPFTELNKNYVIGYLDSLGDTNMGIAMRDVFDNKNCVFSYNSNSHPTAFQTYLPDDETPFCLFGSEGQNSNTIVHEIGHYYADYTNHDINNYDLCETHSQGNEYLFIKYCEGKLSSKIYSAVRYYELFNSYYSIVCAAAIDAFEQRIYSLESVEDMTSADFDAIMDEVLVEFGEDNAWFTENLTDMHTYWRNVAVSNPVYYISYSISSIASLEIFALAEDDYENAILTYTKLVDGIEVEDGFLGALEKAGLTSPFDEETFKKIRYMLSK
jgi:hypothetical protein